EPRLPQARVDALGGGARLRQRRLELAERDALLLLVALDRVVDAADLRLEQLAGSDHLEPLVVERRGEVSGKPAELFAVAVGRQHGEPRLRRSQRQLIVLELDPRGENRGLEGVLTLREVGGNQPGLAGLPQAVEPLSLVALSGLLLGLAERLQLLPREEIGVAGDDLRALRDLLLPVPDGAALHGALLQITL